MSAAHDTQALADLIDAYAEARHKHGAPEYSQVSAAARKTALDALASRLQEQEGQPAIPRLPNAVHLGTMHSTIGAGRMPSETKIYGYTEEQMLAFARATLASGSQAVQVPGWRPIDSAPKDGTGLLALWLPIAGYAAFPRCYAIAHFSKGNWRSVDDGDEEYTEPSLWMPLPAAPLQPLAGGEA